MSAPDLLRSAAAQLRVRALAYPTDRAYRAMMALAALLHGGRYYGIHAPKSPRRAPQVRRSRREDAKLDAAFEKAKKILAW